MRVVNSKIFLTAICAGCLIIPGIAQAQSAKSSSKVGTAKEYEVKKDKGIEFSVFGDWGRNGEDNQKEVAKIMGEKGVGKFIITAGDNFQINGVRSVQDPLWMTTFESIYQNTNLMCDWYPALGNHDYKGEVQAEIDYSKISRRWNMPARYYAIHKKINDSASVDFYILDTPPFQSKYYSSDEHHVAGQDTAKQMRWLDSCMTNSKSTWKLVFGHHPVYSSGSGHGTETAEMEARFANFFNKKGVDAYFCGHDHHFEYIKSKDSKVNYFVCGTGSEVRPLDAPLKSTVFAKSVPGFTKVLITPTKMKVTMIDVTGAEIYTTEIAKKL
jgi:hypothetical protein